jgi:hypothetical protein
LHEICNVLDEASFFEQQGYQRTASQISELAIRVEQKKICALKDVFGEVIKISDTFRSEFEEAYPIGKEYRKKCFSQTQLIVFGGLIAMDKTQLPPPEFLLELLKKMNQRDDYITSLSKSLSVLLQKSNPTAQESKEMFRDACTIYEQSIEGIFSSAIKIMYFLIEKMGVCIPEFQENNTVWDIWNNFEKAHVDLPVILENWPEKNHIRNAIAHSQNHYDPVLDKVNFFNLGETGKVTYESPKEMTFSDFFEIWMQITDAIDSLRYSMRLYGIFQSLGIALQS